MEGARKFSKNSQWLLAHYKVIWVVLDICSDEQTGKSIEKLNENSEFKQPEHEVTLETALTTAWFNKGKEKPK